MTVSVHVVLFSAVFRTRLCLSGLQISDWGCNKIKTRRDFISVYFHWDGHYFANSYFPRGRDLSGRGHGLVRLHRSAYTQWLLERRESKQFPGPPRLAKNMRKKLIKILKLVESQEKLNRKDAEAPRVSFIYIDERGGLILN